MTQTPRLGLPYLAQNQTSKHVTLNETLRRLDALVQLCVASRSLSTPPATPQEGDAYIVPAGATGAWEAGEAHLRVWQDGAWQTFVPREGWRAWVADEAELLVHAGGAWSAPGQDFAGVSTLGVNTDADPTNRLAVKSDAVLLSHDDVTPGTGDLRLVLNKAGPSQTASLVLQSDWSARAQLGLAGQNDFAISVSDDGTAFTEALRIDAVTGQVALPVPGIGNRRRVVLDAGSGTYTVPEGVRALEVTVIGGGGGGAGAETGSAGVFVGAGGGGAGGLSRCVISTGDLQPAYSYVVGAGGSGGSAAPGDPVGSRDGGAGGETRFEAAGLALVAGGGCGAKEDAAAAGASDFAGGAGGVASGGDLNIPGQDGSGGLTQASGFYQLGFGTGGSCLTGLGGAFRNGDGSPGLGYGAGGSGCGMVPGYVLNRTGGGGAGGAVLIEEFY